MTINITCAFCAEVDGSCYVCNGSKRINIFQARKFFKYIWSLDDCNCNACEHSRKKYEWWNNQFNGSFFKLKR